MIFSLKTWLKLHTSFSNQTLFFTLAIIFFFICKNHNYSSWHFEYMYQFLDYFTIDSLYWLVKSCHFSRLQCFCGIWPWKSAKGLGRLGHKGRPTEAELLCLRVWEVLPIPGRGRHWPQEGGHPVPWRWDHVRISCKSRGTTGSEEEPLVYFVFAVELW